MKILEDIYLVKGPVNCYLIERDENCILIDAGMSKNPKNIVQTIQNNFPEKQLTAVILTHSHVDHISGIIELSKKYSLSIIAHEEEIPYLMKEKELPTVKGFRGFLTKMLEKMSGFTGINVDKPVRNNDVISGLKILHYPGHTPGTIAIFDEQSKALFVGDIINSDNKGDRIFPPKKHFAVNYEEALESSIRMFEETSPSVVLPGHGKPFLQPEKLILPYLKEFKTK